MAEVVLLESAAPAWLLQYHGTFSYTLDLSAAMNAQENHPFLEIAWKINVRIAFSFVLGFPHLWEYLFVPRIDKRIKHKRRGRKKRNSKAAN